MGRFRDTMRRSAIVVAGVVAVFTGLGIAAGKVSEEVRALDRDAAVTGTSLQALTRDAAALSVALGDSALGRQSAVDLASFTQNIRLARVGIGQLDHVLASRAGVNLFDLDSSNPERLRRQLVDVYKAASPEQRDILAQLFPANVFQAVRAEAIATGDVLARMEEARRRAVPSQQDLQSLTSFSSAWAGVTSAGGALATGIPNPDGPHVDQRP